MTIAQDFLQELEQESQTTRRFLEQIPADKLNWKPHEKSLTAGQLALHIATIPGGIADMGAKDISEMPSFGFPQPESVDEILAQHDESTQHAARTLGVISDDHMKSDWSLHVNGSPAMTMPRFVFYRSILFNHLYHHRGQLGVYLRLTGATVPSAYGPSADEIPPAFEKIMAAMTS